LVEGEGAAGSGGDEVAAVVDERVVPFAQVDEVVQAGAAAVGPVLDVVQVGAAGFAAGVAAAAVVALAGGAAQRGGRAAAAPAEVQDGAVAVVPHPAQGRGAGDHLRGADADRGTVLDVAAGRVRWVTRYPGGRGRFRGDVGRDFVLRAAGAAGLPGGGQGVGADVDDDLVYLGVADGGLVGQERLGDHQ